MAVGESVKWKMLILVVEGRKFFSGWTKQFGLNGEIWNLSYRMEQWKIWIKDIYPWMVLEKLQAVWVRKITYNMRVLPRCSVWPNPDTIYLSIHRVHDTQFMTCALYCVSHALQILHPIAHLAVTQLLIFAVQYTLFRKNNLKLKNFSTTCALEGQTFF